MATTQKNQDYSEAKSIQESSGEPAVGMSVAEAGRRGGKATAKRYGREFYQAIGRKGGAVRATDEDVLNGDLGRKGAEARWRQETDFGAEIARHTGAQSLSTREGLRRFPDIEVERALVTSEEL